jgi:hypothetical protein
MLEIDHDLQKTRVGRLIHRLLHLVKIVESVRYVQNRLWLLLLSDGYHWHDDRRGERSGGVDGVGSMGMRERDGVRSTGR